MDTLPAGRADRDRRADDPRLAAALRRLRGRRPVRLGRDGPHPEPAGRDPAPPTDLGRTPADAPGEPGRRRPASARRPDDALRGVAPGPAGSAPAAPPTSAGSLTGSPQGGCAMRKPLLSLAAVALVAAACSIEQLGGSPAARRRVTTRAPSRRPTPPAQPAATPYRRRDLSRTRESTRSSTPTRTGSRPSRSTSTPRRTRSRSATSTTATGPTRRASASRSGSTPSTRAIALPTSDTFAISRRRRADAVHATRTRCCSGSGSRRARCVDRARPDAALTFVIDTSGSMAARGPARARQGFAAQARRRARAATTASRS